MVDWNNSIGPGGVTTVLGVGLSSYFSYKASKSSKKINDKVGNGFTEKLFEKMDRVQESADRAEIQATEAKRIAAASNAQIRKTKGIVDNLTGKFDQHIIQHTWIGQDRRKDTH